MVPEEPRDPTPSEVDQRMTSPGELAGLPRPRPEYQLSKLLLTSSREKGAPPPGPASTRRSRMDVQMAGSYRASRMTALFSAEPSSVNEGSAHICCDGPK